MSPKREPVTEDRLRNFKYFGKILPLLDRLHDAGTARDRAGNRLLHFDQYIALQLLFFFNPVKGVPADMDLTLADASEVDHLLAHLQPGRVYVKDRGYCCFRLFQAIVDSGSHVVCRARDNSVYIEVPDRIGSAALFCALAGDAEATTGP